MLLFPLLLDAEHTAGDVVAQSADMAASRDAIILVEWRDRLRRRWFVFPCTDVVQACTAAIAARPVREVLALRNDMPEEARRCDVRDLPRLAWSTQWTVVFDRARWLGVVPPSSAPASAADEPGPMLPAPAPAASVPPTDATPVAPPPHATRGGSRGHQPHAAAPGPTADAPSPTGAAPEPDTAVDTLLALPRVDLPDRCPTDAGASVTLTIGLGAPAAATDAGIMTFTSAHTDTTLGIDVMVEAPDFTCALGWKHALTVDKARPYDASLSLPLVPIAGADTAARQATVRVHYSWRGQPAGSVARVIALGTVSAEEVRTMVQPGAAPLHLAPTSAPVDLTIRIARRDDSDAARELIWTLLDCAHLITLPDGPIVHKVGDRDTTSSFASKVVSQVNAADGTVTIDSMLRGIGTLIRRAMPPAVVAALLDVATAVGPGRLAHVLLLTDECFVPWELALLDAPPDVSRAPYLGAQLAVSRWLLGDADVPVPPPATLAVRNLAVVLGNYDASSLAALPHAKEESDALQAASTGAPDVYPRVTTVNATPEALVDLLNGALPSAAGQLAPEMVHFACHGEVLGTGVAKRSVLYMSDGTPLSEFLFVSSALGKTTRSFLFMNACQVGNGATELNQYAGFPGMAIGAGFSGFVGPLWSVNDQIAKGIALDFYALAFGAGGGSRRPVAEVLADLRSRYALEPDPKKRQSTWLAYVHYGHPHFAFTHA